MTLNDQKNLLSQSWLLALAASAKINVLGEPKIDDDSVDMVLQRRSDRRPLLEVQLKCTKNATLNQEFFGFSLSAKNYEDLRSSQRINPAILAILVVPSDCGLWLQPQPADQHWQFSHDIFWLSLRGMPSLAVGAQSTTIKISTSARLTPTDLNQIFDSIESGTFP